MSGRQEQQPNPPGSPQAAHRLSCFQRWKKSWAAISVGWKNLLMVTGSFKVRACGAPPYLAGKKGEMGRFPPPWPETTPRPDATPFHQAKKGSIPAPWPEATPTHRKRTDRRGGVRKSRRHSMLSTCCTCAPPSTCAATRLVCTASCGLRGQGGQRGGNGRGWVVGWRGRAGSPPPLMGGGSGLSWQSQPGPTLARSWYLPGQDLGPSHLAIHPSVVARTLHGITPHPHAGLL